MTIPLNRRASRQVQALAAHYDALDRPEAIDNLVVAIRAAQAAIPQVERHAAAPRPYPEIAKPGTAWIKSGRYWIAYSLRKPQTIRAVFYDQADIPGRT